MFDHLSKKFKNINIFILITLFLLGFALFYFFYYRLRNQSVVYVSLRVVSAVSGQIQAGIVPYWTTKSISIGNKDISPLGGVRAEVVDMETYEAGTYGDYVNLLMKINAVKDRSGIYLFNNKPLLVGDIIDLKLTKSHIQGLVTDISQSIPVYEYKKLKVKIIWESVDPMIAQNLIIGSKITGNKGQIIARILDTKINPSSINFKNAFGEITAYGDPSKRKDIEMNFELLVKQIGDNYYYAATQKIQVGEKLTINFPNITINGLVVNIENIK